MALSVVTVGSVFNSSAAGNGERRTHISIDSNDDLVIERNQLADTSMGKDDRRTMFI